MWAETNMKKIFCSALTLTNTKLRKIPSSCYLFPILFSKSFLDYFTSEMQFAPFVWKKIKH